jgi:DinB superfamily
MPKENVAMSEIPRLQDLLRRIYDGHAFYGDSITAVLSGIDTEEAFWVPAGGSHCIWQILRHMTVWTDIIRRRLTSPTIIEVESNEENFPTAPLPTRENWNTARDGFQTALDALIEAMGYFPEEKLQAQVPEREYTYYMLLHGEAHHALYHLGQIALMKMMYKRLRSRAESA